MHHSFHQNKKLTPQAGQEFLVHVWPNDHVDKAKLIFERDEHHPRRGTLQAVCTDWLGIADPETIRGYLNDQLRVEALPELERQLNAALAAQTPKQIYRAPQDVAIDIHDRPYYGKQPQETALWIRCQAKDGTMHFYRIATAYVMLKDRRVTLAVCFVLPEDDTLTVLQDLLQRLHGRAIRIACLFLDKGFNGIAILR